MEEALGIGTGQLNSAALAQSERQQLALAAGLHRLLDARLDVALRAGTDARVVHGHVVAWKGAVLERQRHARLARSRPELAGRLRELQDTSRRLAALALSPPAADQLVGWRRQLETLTRAKEAAEAELARLDAALLPAQVAAMGSDAVRDALPLGAVAIDFLEYGSAPLPAGKRTPATTRRLAAFVLAPGRPVRAFDLGPATAVGEAVHRWRADAQGKRSCLGPGAGADLRRLIWEPLADAVTGASLVLVSPDGPLTGLPLAALPGKPEGTYLIEEVTVVTLSVPRLLPEFLAADRAPVAPSLLLMGDVDFGADPGVADAAEGSRSAWRGDDGRPAWQALPGTRHETRAVGNLFHSRHPDGKITDLSGAGATEGAFRKAAPGHRWVHLATHGFFAPPAGGGDDVTGVLPGLMSGLVLAGANRPPAAGGDDGILTSLEVMDIDFRNVDLVVLSACETGLGRVAQGEGVLGLQRALQTAGAASTVTSLWNVNDAATARLMARFYRNLWKGSVSRGQALREAQLWLLREGVKEKAVDARGLRRESDGPTDPQADRVPPYFWAPFVLAGDWR